MTVKVKRISRRQQGLPPAGSKHKEKSINELATFHTTECNYIIYNSTREMYRGQMKDYMRHGRGQMIYDNGIVYEGLWENDKPKHVQIYIEDPSFLDMIHAWLEYNA
jgi:hypothetical protein